MIYNGRLITVVNGIIIIISRFCNSCASRNTKLQFVHTCVGYYSDTFYILLSFKRVLIVPFENLIF